MDREGQEGKRRDSGGDQAQIGIGGDMAQSGKNGSKMNETEVCVWGGGR